MDADHVSGARPAAAPDMMWTCGNAVCWCSVSVLLCWQACGGDGDAVGGGIKLLWADFGHARIVPGLDRHSPAAQVAHCFKAVKITDHTAGCNGAAQHKLLPDQDDQHSHIAHLPAGCSYYNSQWV